MDKEKKIKKIVTIALGLFVAFSVVFLVAKETMKSDDAVSSAPEKTESTSGKQNRVNVYYFHTTFRCPSCNAIENHTKSSVEDHFKKELESGTVVFEEVNVDLEENKHYIKGFELYTKQVIVELIKNGKQEKWKNLDQVWKLFRDGQQFSAYIHDEVGEYLKEVK